jgi:hypothetical protein
MQELQALQNRADPTLVEIEVGLNKELYDLLEQEDLKWKQRAKENWLRFGDRNTKYIHACATQRY